MAVIETNKVACKTSFFDITSGGGNKADCCSYSYIDTYTPTNGQTVFNTTVDINDKKMLMFFVNGQKQRYNQDYTISVKTVTWISSVTLSDLDYVEIVYE